MPAIVRRCHTFHLTGAIIDRPGATAVTENGCLESARHGFFSGFGGGGFSSSSISFWKSSRLCSASRADSVRKSAALR